MYYILHKLAIVGDPAPLPAVPAVMLVEQAGHGAGGGNRVQDAEHPYLHHQPLQLVHLRRSVVRAHLVPVRIQVFNTWYKIFLKSVCKSTHKYEKKIILWFRVF